MATDRTSLGDRMKEYEGTTKHNILRRTPVIIRVDGRAFHTFVKRIKSALPTDRATPAIDRFVEDASLVETPYSIKLHNVMNATAMTLFVEIQNAAFVYTQSDEISILLKDWDRHETQQWFGGSIQKMCSLSASIATAAFNFHFQREFNFTPTYTGDLAHFDSRVFNLPNEEVTNYFVWRQQDASRNSIQMYGRHFFTQKEMNGKSNNDVLDMLVERGNNWNDLPTWMKRGSCVYTHRDWSEVLSSPRGIIDDEIPIFTQNRQFVERHLSIVTQEEQIDE